MTRSPAPIRSSNFFGGRARWQTLKQLSYTSLSTWHVWCLNLSGKTQIQSWHRNLTEAMFQRTSLWKQVLVALYLACHSKHLEKSSKQTTQWVKLDCIFWLCTWVTKGGETGAQIWYLIHVSVMSQWSPPTAVRWHCSRLTNTMISRANGTSFLFPLPSPKVLNKSH